jgi:hypothetical protein
MHIWILAVILGVVISAACLGIPQFVRIRNTQPDYDDTNAYLKQTGRSAGDIEQANAEARARDRS